MSAVSVRFCLSKKGFTLHDCDGGLPVVCGGYGVTAFPTSFRKARKQSPCGCGAACMPEREDRRLRLFTSGESTTADRFKIHAMKKGGNPQAHRCN